MEQEPPIAAELVEQVLAKFARVGGFAAVLVGEAGPPDLDGVRWKFVVTDGDEYALVDADLSGSQGGARGMPIDQAALEGAVEARAVNGFPVESRLPDLREASPLSLRREDL